MTDSIGHALSLIHSLESLLDRERADNRRLRLLVAELLEHKPVAPFERTPWLLSPSGFAYDSRPMREVLDGFVSLWRLP